MGRSTDASFLSIATAVYWPPALQPGVGCFVGTAIKQSPKIFYGWFIVAASFTGMALSSAFANQGFGTYIIPLQNEFGWSKTALSAGRSLTQVEGGLIGPIEGWLIDRLGPRFVMVVGMVILGAGLIIFGLVNSLAVYYGALLVIALGASFAGFLVMTVVLNNWFRRDKTLAMGFASSGIGIGGIFLLPVLVWVQNTYGWREAAVASGIVV